MTIDIVNELLAPSGATLKFNEEGQVHRIVIDDAKRVPATDFVTGEPQKWDDGNIKEQLVITGISDGEPAKLYVKYWGAQKRAFSSALLDAGIVRGDSLEGGTLIVKWVSTDEPTKAGLSGAKQFKMKFERAAKARVDEDLF